MTDEQLIEKFLEEIEHILYLEVSVNDKYIAETIVQILEKEYDI